jgi:uncharacterized YccA/Bax inhibitor family protein
MRTHNPVFGERFAQAARAVPASGSMSVKGVIDKSVIMLLLIMITATYTWNNYLNESVPVQAWMLFGLIGGLVAALATIFRPAWAPVTAPIYALAEGLVLGSVSVYFNLVYPGLPFQAVALTGLVLLTMLGLYRFRIIRVTEKLRSGIIAATLAVFLFYMLSFVLGLFGVPMGIFTDSSPLGIGLSLLIVGIAAFNLLLDFDFIERASSAGMPGYMNWYAAFGLMVTLIWLYLEILRLLARLRNN